ncbi:hypothetical protein KKG83_02375 [Candidatus Micrarchaeota archaeon]|nr:hypothetical protein [Candidatus Micrarchaeota archaeon]MBU2476297.1 hypothetical protein [Candidatus Micrarchaeota archaeon]
MKKIVFVCLILIVFFSGCLLFPEIKIRSAEVSGEKILIQIKSNKWVEAEIKVEDRAGNLFCEKTVNLNPDDNLIEISCDLTEERIQIEVFAEDNNFSRKFTVELITDDLKENQNEQNEQEKEEEEKVEEYNKEEAAKIALILTEKTLEGQFMKVYEENFAKSSECTAIKYIENKNKVIKEFPELESEVGFNLNETQIIELEKQIAETEKCICSVKKEIIEKEKNQFSIKYLLDCKGECKETYFEPFTEKQEVISTNNYSEGERITNLEGKDGEKYYIDIGTGAVQGYENKITLSLFLEEGELVNSSLFKEGKMAFYNDETGKEIIKNSITIKEIKREVSGETENYSALIERIEYVEYYNQFSLSIEVNLTDNSVKIGKYEISDKTEEQIKKNMRFYELMEECLKAWLMKTHEKVLESN